MKKRFGVGLIVAILLVVGIGTATYAYVASRMYQQFVMAEPIETTLVSTTRPVDVIYPGEVFTTTFRVRNVSTAGTYGMWYAGLILWSYIPVDDEGVAAQSTQLRFNLADQPISGNVIRLEKPETGQMPQRFAAAGAGGGWYPGTVRLEISFAEEGVYSPYVPTERIDLGPNSSHLLRVTVRTSAGIPPGEWKLSFSADRGEPSGLG